MKTRAFKYLIAAVVALATVSSASQASATSIVMDFSTGLAGTGGTVVQSGTDYTGSGIFLDLMTVTVNGIEDVYNLDGTSTGKALPFAPSAAVFAFNTATGIASVTGTIPTLGINAVTQLFTGIISNVTVISNNLFLAFEGFNTVDPILSALNLPSGALFNWDGSVLALSATSRPGTFTASSTDILTTNVPEPGSLMLLGTGLIALGARARNRLRRKAAK